MLCTNNMITLFIITVIPVFPRPTVNDQPINPPNNTLQFMGNGKHTQPV